VQASSGVLLNYEDKRAASFFLGPRSRFRCAIEVALLPVFLEHVPIMAPALDLSTDYEAVGPGLIGQCKTETSSIYGARSPHQPPLLLMSEAFRKFARYVSEVVGSVGVFIVAVTVVLAWVVTGPIFGFSDTWQLVINTATTVVTFLMVFLIQNTQNRDNLALQAKLDELIVATKGADNRLVLAEELTDEQFSLLKSHFEKVANNRRATRGAASGERRRINQTNRSR
jgi:low affinity Fe/Cu permease